MCLLCIFGCSPDEDLLAAVAIARSMRASEMAASSTSFGTAADLLPARVKGGYYARRCECDDGFVIAKGGRSTWAHCESCRSRYCYKCKQAAPLEQAGGHVCDSGTLEMLRALKVAGSKQCPTCCVPILRPDEKMCEFMHCTNCNTNFAWNTRAVIRKDDPRASDFENPYKTEYEKKPISRGDLARIVASLPDDAAFGRLLSERTVCVNAWGKNALDSLQCESICSIDKYSIMDRSMHEYTQAHRTTTPTSRPRRCCCAPSTTSSSSATPSSTSCSPTTSQSGGTSPRRRSSSCTSPRPTGSTSTSCGGKKTWARSRPTSRRSALPRTRRCCTSRSASPRCRKSRRIGRTTCSRR